MKEVFFRAGRAVVRIASESRTWLEAFTRYLAVSWTALPLSWDLELTMLEADRTTLESRLPLPDKGLLRHEGPCFFDDEATYRFFAEDHRSWIDWERLGRIHTDSKEGKALAVKLFPETVDPFLDLLVFGYNPLMGLFSKKGYQSVHAACVDVNGKGVLLTGMSGGGKSTAAAAMLLHGHRLVSDDRLLLFQEEVYKGLNLSDVFKVRKDAIAGYLPGLSSLSPLHEWRDEIYFKASEHPAFRFVTETEIRALAVFKKTGRKETSINRIHPAHVVKDLFPVTMNPYDPKQSKGKFLFLMTMMGEIPCFQVHMGTDLERFAQCMEKTLEKQG